MVVTATYLQLIDTASQSKRYIVTFFISVLVLFLLLLLPPIKKVVGQSKEKSIKLILNKVQVTVDKKDKIIIEKTKPRTQTKVKNKLIVREPAKQIKVEVIMLKSKPVTTEKPQPLPTVATLLNTIKMRKKVVKLGQEFQAQTGREDDFVLKTVGKDQMFIETKLVNEDTDKPEYEMNFYSEGVEGSVERFMDKITYKKRFTTKYGTKIDCAAVTLVIVTCSWK